jgi:hypothetical protein
VLALPSMDNQQERDLYSTDIRGQGNASCLKYLTAGSGAGGANSKTFSIFLNSHHLQGREVTLDICPLELMPSRFQAPVKFFAQDEGQKAAENMSAYGFDAVYGTSSWSIFSLSMVMPPLPALIYRA